MSTTPQVPNTLFSDSEMSATPTTQHAGDTLFSDEDINPPSGPTDTQKTYRQATASGPYAPAGASERAMGAEFGDNTAQARQALHSTLAATGYTAA